MNEVDFPQVEKLIQELEESVISEQDHAYLMELIVADPEVAKLYFEHMETVALLKQVVKDREELGTLPVSAYTLSQSRRRNAAISLAYGIAAMVLIGIGFLFYKVNVGGATGVSPIVMESSNQALYSIKFTGGEERDISSLEVGDSIVLEQGVLRLTFPSGVEAIVEAPSELELTSELSLKMEGGLAWFRVPEAGHGFEVQTERLKVIDLGTEFGVCFDGDKQLQVHVAQGKVEVVPKMETLPKYTLTEDQAMSFDVFGQGGDIKVSSSLFRQEFTENIPYIHWSFDKVNGQEFAASGTMLGSENGNVSLRKMAKGSIDGAEYLTPGQFGNALSLSGDGVFAQTAIKGVGGNAPRTLAMWVRHRQEDVSEGRVTPYCVWGSRTSGRLWKISLKHSDESGYQLFTVPLGIRFTTKVNENEMAEWMHLVTTYTGRVTENGEPEVLHYINGERQQVQCDKDRNSKGVQTAGESGGAIRFGAPYDFGENRRTLNADIDEVYLFRGVLSDNQIKELMNENRLKFFVH